MTTFSFQRLVGRSSVAVLPLALLVSGCIGHRVVHPVMPDADELAVFNAAGPDSRDVDADQLLALNVSGGEYRIVTGDLLEVQVPAELVSDEVEGEATVSIRARVAVDGTIKGLPQLGEIKVGGKTLSTIEEEVAGLYHPAIMTDKKPNIVVVVAEYRVVSVAVMGAVKNPGIHELRSNRTSLLAAVMEAGGIDATRGASQMRVHGSSQSPDGSPILLPVRDTNIPFRDLALGGGETIVVEPVVDREFTIIGLVRKPGVHPYPSHTTYNLMQCLAVAGGVDEFAAPRFASVYRKDADGKVIGVTFQIDGLALMDSSNVLVKAGDVIAVEHTLGSWIRQFLGQVLGFRASFSLTSAGRVQ